MPINNITQTISTLPPAGSRGVDVQTQFVIKQEDFQDHLQGITVTELNTLKDQLNSRIGEINSTTTTMNGYANTASAGASTATTKAGEASTSAGEALSYKNQAETFKNNASASATKASQWADNNYNVEVETGKYSAKHWSTVAQNATANKIDKVASTDNAIVRFDGTTGEVQSSGVIIDDNGNVGIGVTPNNITPGYLTLQIHASAGLALMSSSNDTHLSTNAYYNSGYKYQNSGVTASDYAQGSGDHYWRTAPSGTAGSPITWTTAMTLNGSSSLNVFGNVVSGFSGTSYATPGSYIGARAVDANTHTILYARSVADANATYASYVGGILKSAILATGTFQSATNVYGSTSDIKLKENVVDTTPKLDKLMQVQVRNFNYIGQEEKQIGVIAQEIETIFPSIVFETKDTKQVEVTKTRDITDVDGNVIKEEYTEFETQETGEVTKNVKYSIIYMMMLKGMQEQQASINDLKARIEILEGAK